MTDSVGGTGQGKQSAVKSETARPKKLSKMGEWRLAHPHGLEGTYDMRAVMR